MKCKFYCHMLIMLGFGCVGIAHAQTTAAWNDPASMGAVPVASASGRWYIAPTLGGYYNDADRQTDSRQIYYGFSLGRFFSPHVSIDLFLDHTRRNAHAGGPWSSDNLGVAARFHLGERNTWRPYLLAGLLASHHRGQGERGWAPAGEVGAGLAIMTTDSLDVRLESGYRYERDNKTRPSEHGYGDWFFGLGAVSWFGTPAVAPVRIARAKDCAVLDGDLDDVSDCEDRCPDTVRGVIVGPDGCLQQNVVIDLRGVNFKFDRPKKGETDISGSLAEPSTSSLAVLDQAADTLRRYPQLRVTVAGYTDDKGSDAYNLNLSRRRAKIVYDYLAGYGIDPVRMNGPIGHGEQGPIGDNASDEGRSLNRRTELQILP